MSENNIKEVKKMIETHRLTKSFYQGTTEIVAVNSCSVVIREGEFIAVTGASGSGKSTLLQLLGGLISPDSGAIFVDGENLSQIAPEKAEEIRRRKIGFIFQEYNLIPFLSAKENIILPSLADRNDFDEEYVRRLADLLKITDRLKHLPSQLSGGEQQRVAIARALINKPKIILADEPTGALDSANGTQCMEMLKKINSEGTTIIVVTHSDTVASYCSRTVKMKDGCIV